MISMRYSLTFSSKISSQFYKTYSINGLCKVNPVVSEQMINTRPMAYVSNKRITRLASDYEVDRIELNQDSNERYIDVRLRNRNPRNLEQMLMEPKPMGFEMDQPNRHYWNKVIFEKKSKYLLGKIVHYSGRTIITASTNEPTMAIVLGNSRLDVQAAVILGQVLATRALEAGIHSVFYDPKEYRQNEQNKSEQKGKILSFIQALSDNGLNLNEQPVIVLRAQRDH